MHKIKYINGTNQAHDMKIFKKTLIAATLLLSITSAQAALVESDWQNTGDALATLDTETGIEWLDLTQTVFMSINEAEELTGSSGTFDGWRLPTRLEVNNLFQNMFPQHSFNDGRSSFTSFSNYSALFGVLQYGSRGMYVNDEMNERGGTQVLWASVDSNGWVYEDSNLSHSLDHKRNDFGVWLVSDGGTTISSIDDPSMNANNANAPVDNVSSPALLGLMGLGLFGFAARRRSSTTLNK
jgi:MYXO-CTERM domain-containing protein